MHKAIGVLAPIVVAVSLAACGSSKSATSSSSSKPASPSSAYGGSTSTAASAATTAPATVITTKTAKGLGTILAAGPKTLTVYMFSADKGSSSSCSGACLVAWPPVVGNPHAGGAAKSADFGTIKRADGTTQVTYKGHPLYMFKKDKDDGDAYGQKVVNFGGSWHVLTPAGVMVETSPPKS